LGDDLQVVLISVKDLCFFFLKLWRHWCSRWYKFKEPTSRIYVYRKRMNLINMIVLK